jgi:hypothetical protein
MFSFCALLFPHQSACLFIFFFGLEFLSKQLQEDGSGDIQPAKATIFTQSFRIPGLGGS